MRIGAQLFTVRDFCKDLDSLAETLKKVADIGYTTVQVSGTCGYEAQWLRDALNSAGLTCGITHYSYDKILNQTEKTIEDHKTFGCAHIGVGSNPYGFDNYEKFKETAKAPAAKIHEAGLKFMYHNHHQEYDKIMPDGRPLMHHMSEDFTADELGFTLDTYWVKYAGYDVIAEIERLSGRLPVVHYKDMLLTDGGEKRMSWVGGGNTMDFEKITAAFEKAGTELIYIEQDNCYGEDPFACLKKSYEYLKSIGLR